MYTFVPSYIRRHIIAHIFLTILTLGIWILILPIIRYIVQKTHKLTVDLKTVTYKSGLIVRHEREIDVRDVRSVKISQSLVSRLFGLGDIEISSSSGMDDQIIVYGISDPDRVRKIVRAARAKREKLEKARANPK